MILNTILIIVNIACLIAFIFFIHATNKNTSDANVAYSAVTNHGIIFKN